MRSTSVCWWQTLWSDVGICTKIPFREAHLLRMLLGDGCCLMKLCSFSYDNCTCWLRSPKSEEVLLISMHQEDQTLSSCWTTNCLNWLFKWRCVGCSSHFQLETNTRDLIFLLQTLVALEVECTEKRICYCLTEFFSRFLVFSACAVQIAVGEYVFRSLWRNLDSLRSRLMNNSMIQMWTWLHHLNIFQLKRFNSWHSLPFHVTDESNL